MTEYLDRYRRRADVFEKLVAGVAADQWSNPSPCEEWDARAVVGHILDMHGVVVRPLGRQLDTGPGLDADPLAAFRAARRDLETVLADPELAGTTVSTPMGEQTLEQHIDQVPSADMPLHGWDLARATGQDDTIDPVEVAAYLPFVESLGEEWRTPGAFGPGVVVFGPEVDVPDDATPQQRMLGLIGRNPF